MAAKRSRMYQELEETVDDEPDDIKTTPKAKARTKQVSLFESSLPATMGARLGHGTNGPVSRKRSRQSCDYDDQHLASMSYADLANQAFDVDPQSTVSAQAPAMPSREPLRLEDKVSRFQHKDEATQRVFFQNLSLAEWESAGDWFTGQFADMMGRMRDARKKRRKVIADFEEEVAVQEEAVRVKSENFEKRLRKMKEDGERVMREAC